MNNKQIFYFIWLLIIGNVCSVIATAAFVKENYAVCLISFAMTCTSMIMLVIFMIGKEKEELEQDIDIEEEFRREGELQQKGL